MLNLIKKIKNLIIDEKNVSVHTMTNYNQNPLHLACQKGYSLIINYLIEKGCDQTLIDNYGNISLLKIEKWEPIGIQIHQVISFINKIAF